MKREHEAERQETERQLQERYSALAEVCTETALHPTTLLVRL